MSNLTLASGGAKIARMNDLQRNKARIVALAAQAGRDAVAATCKAGLPVTHAVNGKVVTEFIEVDVVSGDSKAGLPRDAIAA